MLRNSWGTIKNYNPRKWKTVSLLLNKWHIIRTTHLVCCKIIIKLLVATFNDEILILDISSLPTVTMVIMCPCVWILSWEVKTPDCEFTANISNICITSQLLPNWGGTITLLKHLHVCLYWYIHTVIQFTILKFLVKHHNQHRYMTYFCSTASFWSLVCLYYNYKCTNDTSGAILATRRGSVHGLICDFHWESVESVRSLRAQTFVWLLPSDDWVESSWETQGLPTCRLLQMWVAVKNRILINAALLTLLPDLDNYCILTLHVRRVHSKNLQYTGSGLDKWGG